MVLLWTCTFAALGGFLFGYDLGLIGGALLQIRRYFGIHSSAAEGLIVGAAKLGATVGTFLGGATMARYGRQRALALNSVAFTVGPLIMAVASAPWMLVLGRFVVGLGVGASATVSPAYIAELAPASTRGMLVQLYEVMLCIGMLSAPLVDWLLSRADAQNSWRAMVGLPALPGLALAAAPLVLPESPRWLVTRDRLDEALQVLTMILRGSGRLASGAEGLWVGDYRRMSDKDDRAVRDAEDELLQLWSGVQLDRNAVLEQRRKLWRLRHQRRGARWGRLGCWRGEEGRPKPPSLEPITEESGSQMPTPSCLSTASSATISGPATPATATAITMGPAAAGRVEELRLAAVMSSSAMGGGSGGGGQSALPTRGSPLRPSEGGSSSLAASSDPGGHLGLAGGRGGGAAAAGAGGTFGRGRLLSAFSRRSDLGGGWAGNVAYRPLAGDDAAGAALRGGGGDDGDGDGDGRGAAGGGLGSRPEPGDEEDERLWSPQSRSDRQTASEPRGAGAGGLRTMEAGPPASLADMPGEEPSFLRTMAMLIADIGALAVGPERRALGLALGLAFFDQVTAATAIINYAPTLLRRMGRERLDEGGAMMYSVAIGATKALGVGAALLLVDRCGRRPLLVTGSLACGVALAGLTAAALAGSADLMGLAMCAFTLFFSLSWAGLYWVVVSELFSMNAKSAATSAATGLLFLTGASTNLVFLSLHDLLGAYVFLLFAAFCLASAVYVWVLLPETKGRSLAEVQAMLVQRDAAVAGRPEVPGAGGAGSRAGVGSGWIQLWERRRGEVL